MAFVCSYSMYLVLFFLLLLSISKNCLGSNMNTFQLYFGDSTLYSCVFGISLIFDRQDFLNPAVMIFPHISECTNEKLLGDHVCFPMNFGGRSIP